MDVYFLKGKNIRLKVTNFGAKIMDLMVDPKRLSSESVLEESCDENNESETSSRFVDVALGYDTLKEYLKGQKYFGATIGRVGNRIAGGKFNCPDSGKEIQISCNEQRSSFPSDFRGNSLHGGFSGFNDKTWTVVSRPSPSNYDSNNNNNNDNNKIEFSCFSQDGDEGYPGDLEVKVRYEIMDFEKISSKNYEGAPQQVVDVGTRTAELHVSYWAKSLTHTTPINLTNHTFFNLQPDHSKTILQHELTLNCDAFLPVNERLIPVGKTANVGSTSTSTTTSTTSVAGCEKAIFDFRGCGKPIGAQIFEEDEQLSICNGGYDHTYVIRGEADERGLRSAGVLRNTDNGLAMEVLTTEPGLQVYTGNFLDGRDTGKKGVKYPKHGAICLETQNFPDCVNQDLSGQSPFLSPGKVYESKTIYRFFSVPQGDVSFPAKL